MAVGRVRGVPYLQIFRLMISLPKIKSARQLCLMTKLKEDPIFRQGRLELDPDSVCHLFLVLHFKAMLRSLSYSSLVLN